MRLLRSDDYALEWFPKHKRPPYAILSHTWGSEELTIKTVPTWPAWPGKSLPKVEELAGCQKIKSFCKAAASNGFKWGWVDTWCINQKESADLSEAINSMYQWYKEADVCYAFLDDVDGNASDVNKQLKKSRWFTRGWTLQELIAPEVVIFYDRNWNRLGSKSSKYDLIASITKVHEEALLNQDLRKFSIAQKMSWAAMRETEKREDEAYCLMGLFRVNMPLIYGEGERAFERLQEEIIRQSRDHTIFAWSTNEVEFKSYFPILAPSPRAFRCARSIVPCDRPYRDAEQPYAITSKGIQIHLCIPTYPGPELELNKHVTQEKPQAIVFNCKNLDKPSYSYLAIFLVKIRRGSDVYYRYGGCFENGGYPGVAEPGYYKTPQLYLATERTHPSELTGVSTPHVYWLRQLLQRERFRICHSSPGRWHEKEEVDTEKETVIDSDIMVIGLTIEDLKMRVRLYIAFEGYAGNNSRKKTKRVLTWKEVEDTQGVSYDELLKSGKETADDYLSTELREGTVVSVTFVPGLKDDRRGYWIDLSANPQ